MFTFAHFCKMRLLKIISVVFIIQLVVNLTTGSHISCKENPGNVDGKETIALISSDSQNAFIPNERESSVPTGSDNNLLKKSKPLPEDIGFISAKKYNILFFSDIVSSIHFNCQTFLKVRSLRN